MATDVDRHLLFGLIALQVGLIDQTQLVAAFQAWAHDRDRPLVDHLVDRGDLRADARAAIEAMVALHLEAHDGDVERSLAKVPAGLSTRDRLAQLGDPELTATLSHVGVASSEPGIAITAGYTVGTSTSHGQRFRVLRPHARGGLGAVFVAIDGELQREVALKQILDDHADDPASRQRFMLEAEITGGLEHPGIVPVYGLGTYAEGRPFYAMRFIRGESLKEAIGSFHADKSLKRDPSARSLALRRLLRRFLDVCNAIDYAHGRGVLHRDIKPGNIIVGKHGETLVIDWGLAKAKGKAEAAEPSEEHALVPSSASGSAETLPGSALGTPSYMSPEQARGELDRLGPQSDVYSLGATLYCLLTGVPPVDGALGDVLRAVQKADFRPPRQRDPTIDRSLEAVCLKAMALEPTDRYPGARALAEDVERWIADEPVSARREPVSARLVRWARRHRTTVAALGLSLATAVVLLTVLNVRVTSAQRETAKALASLKLEQRRTVEALERADANFRHARQAVEDYFTAVSEEVLLDEPGMQGLREKLLRSAMQYHERFFKERAGDPNVEAELAVSHRRYAIINLYTGKHEDPLPHLRIAHERFEGLARQHPDQPEYRKQVARTLADIGAALSDRTTDRDEAVRAERTAIAMFEQLLREQPADEAVVDDLARTLVSLGVRSSEEHGRGEEAAQHMKRARDLMQGLIAKHPESLRIRLKLAELHDGMYTNLVGHQSRQDEALQSSQEALTLYKELLERSPLSPRFKARLGVLHHSRSMFYARKQVFPEAIREARQARTILSDVVAANPENERYRLHLASACMSLGMWLTETGASREALGPLRESCEAFAQILKNRPGDMAFQRQYIGALLSLGSSLARLRRYDEAGSVQSRAALLVADLCRRDPSNIFLLGDLMACKFNLALVLTRSSRRHEEAVAAYEEAWKIGQQLFGGDGWSHGGSSASVGLISMAYSLREVGRDQQAEEALVKGQGFLGKDSSGFYELARYDARGAERLARAGGEARAIESLKLRAMAALQKALTLGFSDIQSVQEFGDAFQLRDRADFQLLLLDVKFPGDPFNTTSP